MIDIEQLKVDESLWPEGATHYTPATEKHRACWWMNLSYRMERTPCLLADDMADKWSIVRVDDDDLSIAIPRPSPQGSVPEGWVLHAKTNMPAPDHKGQRVIGYRVTIPEGGWSGAFDWLPNLTTPQPEGDNGMSAHEKDRAIEMLLVAAKYIEDHCPEGLIEYDGTDCDGYCVANDCRHAAEDIGWERGDD